MSSRAIWALFLNVLIQKGIKQNIVDQILGGGGAPVARAPSKSATAATKWMPLIGLETRWRPGGDTSLRWLRRRLRDATSPGDLPGLRGVAGNSNMIDFLKAFSSLQQVSETSRRLRRLMRRCGDVSATCWRTCLNFPQLPGDPSNLQETSRIRRGDVAATEKPSPRRRGYISATAGRICCPKSIWLKKDPSPSNKMTPHK